MRGVLVYFIWLSLLIAASSVRLSPTDNSANVATSALPTENLWAYIPVTSAGTPLGYHPDFAKNGGWIGFGKDMAARIREGGFTGAVVWRPHGKRPNGSMPVDAMLHLRRDSVDPIERAAADERAFVTCLRMLRSAVDDAAKAAGDPDGRGELWVYLGNEYQAGENETPLAQQSKQRRGQIIRRVLHPMKIAGVDGVAFDASGNAGPTSISAEMAQIAFDEGFAFVGYEGWSDKAKPAALAQWTSDPRMTGFLMGVWYSERDRLYPPSEKVAGRLAVLNPGKRGAREWAATPAERRASVIEMLENGHIVVFDVWTAKTEKLTPKDLE